MSWLRSAPLIKVTIGCCEHVHLGLKAMRLNTLNCCLICFFKSNFTDKLSHIVFSWRSSLRKTTSFTSLRRMATSRTFVPTPHTGSRPSSTRTRLTFRRSHCRSASKCHPTCILVSFSVTSLTCRCLENVCKLGKLTKLTKD